MEPFLIGAFTADCRHTIPAVHNQQDASEECQCAPAFWLWVRHPGFNSDLSLPEVLPFADRQLLWRPLGKQGRIIWPERQPPSYKVSSHAFLAYPMYDYNLDAIIYCFVLYAMNQSYWSLSPLCLQGVYVFYLELITDMLHLFVYLVFFVIVFTNYGLPLHLVHVYS